MTQRNSLDDFTLGVNVLLSKEEYIRRFSFPTNVVRVLEQTRARRNQLHFTMGYAYRVDSEFLDAVEYLNDEIKEYPNKRRP